MAEIVSADTRTRPSSALIIAGLLIGLSIAALIALPHHFHYAGLAAALCFVAVIAEVCSVKFSNKLVISGWDCCALIACLICGYWTGPIIAVAALLAGWIAQPYRASAFIGNIGAIVPAITIASVCFWFFDITPVADSFLVYLDVLLISCAALGLHVMLVWLIFGLLDGFSFGTMVARTKPVLGTLGFQAVFTLSITGLYIAYGAAAVAFASVLVAACGYMAYLLVLAQDRNREAEQLQQLVYSDALTGLRDRRGWNEELPPMLRDCVAILFVDCNEFKEINDEYGHETGDCVLQAFAIRLQETVRGGDLVARYGGDEFVLAVKLEATTATEAVRQAQQLRDRLEDGLHQPVIAPGATVNPYASIGISIYPYDATDPDELCRLADTDMYRVKESASANR